MTARQNLCISNAINHLDAARRLLDSAMYDQNDPMKEEEFKKVREAYNNLCNITDSIYRL